MLSYWDLKKASLKRANIMGTHQTYSCSPSSRTILSSFVVPQASPPSCSGKRQSRARRRLLEMFSYFKFQLREKTIGLIKPNWDKEKTIETIGTIRFSFLCLLASERPRARLCRLPEQEEGEQEHVWCVPIMFALFKDAFFEIQQLNVANMMCFLFRMMEKKLMSRSYKNWINMQKQAGGMYKYPQQRL